MPRSDLHQHLWPEALLRALAVRAAPPRLRRDGREWMLELPGEPPCPVALADHDPVVRALEAERDGIDVVGIALSVPLGIELLPAAEAQPLLDAFHDGVAELGGPFRFWAATALTAPGAGALEIDALLDRGAIGATVPAGALASEVGLVRLSALLSRLEARDAPLFVHPGPAPAAHRGAPSWWPAMTAYVADMHAAWHAWAAWGRALAPAPARAVRDARRLRAAARRAPRRPRRARRRGPRRADVLRRLLLRAADRRRDAARRRRRPARPRLRPPGRRAARSSAPSARRVAHALTEANPDRLLSPDPVTA